MPRTTQPPPDDFARSGEQAEIRDLGDLLDRAAPDPGVFPADLLEARAGIEEVLRSQGDERSGVGAPERLTETTNVQGVGIGRARPTDTWACRSTPTPGQWTLHVYLDQPRDAEDVASVLVERMGARAAGTSDVPVVPVTTGPIVTQKFVSRRRPAPGGISLVSVPNAEDLGTLGCLSTGRSAPRNQRTLIIGCNHVLANSNSGSLGDCVAQPATGDFGSCPADLVAVLERFARLEFGGPINTVDCATAWAAPTDVSPGVLTPSPFGDLEIPISATTTAATVDMAVGKSGRTTEVTTGRVREVGASHWVEYPSGDKAFFSGSIVVQGDVGPFSRKGDSGAIVWTLDLIRHPVGMVFAGEIDGSRSYANPIDIVTQALDVFITA